MGSVFSPYYAWSGRRAPHDHVAINVALYGAPGRWAMTERGADALEQAPLRFTVGPSSMAWDGDDLVVTVDEWTVPLPRRLRGEIRFTPSAFQPQAFALDAAERHHWWPYAPMGRIIARFTDPYLAWQGHGYADANAGTAALEADFRSWDWMRVATSDGAALFYGPQERSGRSAGLALTVHPDGTIEPRPEPPRVDLRRGLWGVGRRVWSEQSDGTRLVQAMEDAPFYTRNAVEVTLGGHRLPGVHETLDLDRFASPWVRTLLPYRMPRRARWLPR